MAGSGRSFNYRGRRDAGGPAYEMGERTMKRMMTLASASLASALLAALAGSIAAQAGPTPTPTDFKAEKCYGIAKAAQNDCQTASHSCAGTSAKDNDAASWIYVPAGTCQKIAGASTMPM
jgi:uncharacterized membrane protein